MKNPLSKLFALFLLIYALHKSGVPHSLRVWFARLYFFRFFILPWIRTALIFIFIILFAVLFFYLQSI